MATKPSWAEDMSELEAELEAQGVWPPGLHGRAAVSAVLCVLAQRLTGGEAQDLVASLPKGLRPLVDGCVRYPLDRAQAFNRAEFLRRVAARLHVPGPQAEAVTRVVFAAVRPRLPHVEVDDVASQLPRDLKDLWLGGLSTPRHEARIAAAGLRKEETMATKETMTTEAYHTGTTDEHYDLVSSLYHALQGADTCVTYLQDAEQAGDQELIQFFREAHGTYRQLAERGKGLLRQRLH
jgi:uncharacterized protein (DUF2267 family)